MPSPEIHDVAIVGAGLAGLTAGARLAERGVRAVVLEKGSDERYPCNARIAIRTNHTSEAPMMRFITSLERAVT